MQSEDNINFELLREWAQLEKVELKSLLSSEMNRVLVYLQSRLGPGYDWPTVITVEVLPDVVAELQYLVKDGSRKLGVAIIKGAEFKDNGNTPRAIEVLSSFVVECPSPCYLEEANRLLKTYGAENSE